MENAVYALCLAVLVNILIPIFKWAWAKREKTEETKDTIITNLQATVSGLTQTVDELNENITELETALSEVPKLRHDLQQYYYAIKSLAGPQKWAEIREELTPPKDARK